MSVASSHNMEKNPRLGVCKRPKGKAGRSDVQYMELAIANNSEVPG